MAEQELPVAVVGAGPVGMAAAAELVLRGEDPLVLESGDAVGAAMRRWAHVRLFSPWRFNIAPVARRLLAPTGWTEPDPEHLPTGGEMVGRYLEPLALVPPLRAGIRLNHRVVAVVRRGLDKLKTAGREEAPFELVVETPQGCRRLLARAVIDASGTWWTPNWLGASGIPAAGEEAAGDRIAYGIPDVLGGLRDRFAGRRVLVVGSGHSAFNVLLDLIELRKRSPGTTISWAVRRGEVGQMFGGGSADALPARGALGSRTRALVETGQVTLLTGFATDAVEAGDSGLVLTSSGRRIGPFDQVVVATGFRPDPSLTTELRLDLDPVVEAPRALAPLIDPNVHSCGTVPPHGAEQLRHPESGYYAVGMKSYGRAPTFLMMTGYEQVRSVVCALTGDEAGAAEVRLVLPETGVCSTQPQVPLGPGRALPVVQPSGGTCCG
jgi:glycine/D-amino acid oxidase-like deaminating enzyme